MDPVGKGKAISSSLNLTLRFLGRINQVGKSGKVFFRTKSRFRSGMGRNIKMQGTIYTPAPLYSDEYEDFDA